MRKLEITVIQRWTLHINDEDGIVQEYKDDKELISDCVVRDFRQGLLPVLQSGGVTAERTDVDFEID